MIVYCFVGMFFCCRGQWSCFVDLLLVFLLGSLTLFFFFVSRLFTSSFDGTIKQWNLSSGKCLMTYIGHLSSVSSMQVEADGQWLVSGDASGEVRQVMNVPQANIIFFVVSASLLGE